MLFLNRPTEERIRALAAIQNGQELSYKEEGASRGQLPSGYRVQHRRVELGRGLSRFSRACEALRQWKMFDCPGIWLCWPTTPIQSGCTVAVLVKHFGFWSLNFCRIVYTIDEDGPIRRFGFAYCTLVEHAERGEERFIIEWDHDSDAVTYDILSFSRPGNWKTFVAYPAARKIQENFVSDSMKAMICAVQQ
jgi:uncharacterized protein (UPF0548 family)